MGTPVSITQRQLPPPASDPACCPTPRLPPDLACCAGAQPTPPITGRRSDLLRPGKLPIPQDSVSGFVSSFMIPPNAIRYLDSIPSAAGSPHNGPAQTRFFGKSSRFENGFTNFQVGVILGHHRSPGNGQGSRGFGEYSPCFFETSRKRAIRRIGVDSTDRKRLAFGRNGSVRLGPGAENGLERGRNGWRKDVARNPGDVRAAYNSAATAAPSRSLA
jgi:hypothetical protein